MTRLAAVLAVLAAVGALALAACSAGAPVAYQAPETARTPDGAIPATPPFGAPAPGGRHVSPAGLHLIEGFEGFSSCPYWDQYGRVWTRGYGETEGIGRGSGCISRAFGETNLRSRIQRYYEWALRGLGRYVAANQHVWDALCSFAWNLGAGIFTGQLRADLQTGRFRSAGQIMLAYVHAGGVVLAGLVRRRQDEVRLMLTPVARPPSRRQIEQRIRVLHRELARYRCRTVHGRRAYRKCPRWAAEGRRLHRELGR